MNKTVKYDHRLHKGLIQGKKLPMTNSVKPDTICTCGQPLAPDHICGDYYRRNKK